jgi:hypothetical protein
VFPVRYELNSYILFRMNLVFKVLTKEEAARWLLSVSSAVNIYAVRSPKRR